MQRPFSLKENKIEKVHKTHDKEASSSRDGWKATANL